MLYKKSLVGGGYRFVRVRRGRGGGCQDVCKFGGCTNEDDDCYKKKVLGYVDLNDLCRYLKRNMQGRLDNWTYVIENDPKTKMDNTWVHVHSSKKS